MRWGYFMETATRYEYINQIILQGYIARLPIFRIYKNGIETALFFIEIEREKNGEISVQSFRCETSDPKVKESLKIIKTTKKKTFVRVEGRLLSFVKVSRYAKVRPQTKFYVESIRSLVITPFLLVDFKKESIPIDAKFIKENKHDGNIKLPSKKPTKSSSGKVEE